MTPAHTDSPLRRSEAGIFREPGAQNPQPVHNDDEEERRTLRRTLLSSSAGETTDASTVEQNENLKKYLEIYCENKLNAKNAWTFGVIDTVAALLERHHKSLNNFTVAGSSLEMSSKVYGMRVDSVHTDVLRMSAGLNARKFRENANDEDDDGVATGGEGNADPNSSANTGIETARTGKRKKQRKKAGATVTKNKETLNARLDTVPMQDPVFGKLNTTVGSINASNRLMNNMLNTVEGELRLRTTHKFWNTDDHDDDEEIDYTDPVAFENMPNKKLLPCERLNRVERFEQLLLRPTNSGYIISDMPITVTDDPTGNIPPYNDDMPDGESSPAVGLFDNCADPMMAFDMNAECEPLPQLDTYAPILDIGEHDEYTVEEHNALGNVRGLRKSAIVIEDMRPVDSTTSLEYSYRPVEKISQFWAGPSHWRFRRNTHHQRSTMGQNGAFGNAQTEANGRRQTKTKGRKRDAGLQGKKRTRIEFAAPVHDNLFIKLDAKYKLRRMNFQKKWDPKKLRLPEDLHLNAHDLVNTRCFAPAFAIYDDNSHALEDVNVVESESIAPTPLEDEHFMADDGGCDEHAAGAVGGDGVDLFDALQESLLAPGETQNASNSENPANLSNTDVRDNVPGAEDKANETVLEIATEYEGAPSQVTKIIVPFAKRAKVIDMKNLKRTCTNLISNQLKATAETINESQMPAHPIQQNEHYAPGIASFQEVYKKLPNLLPPAMAEGLSPSIALYSVLHLANDFNYRLIPQEDLEDLSIRQVLDE